MRRKGGSDPRLDTIFMIEGTLCKVWHKAKRLKEERDDAFGALLVGGIAVGELIYHHFFFVAQFDPETSEREDQPDKAGAAA